MDLKKLTLYLFLFLFSISLVNASILTDILGTKDRVSTLIEENIYSCGDNVSYYVTSGTNSMGRPFKYNFYGDNNIKIEDLKVNDMVIYRLGNSTAVHHRVVELNVMGGVLTKGDTNNINDEIVVTNDWLLSRQCVKGGMM